MDEIFHWSQIFKVWLFFLPSDCDFSIIEAGIGKTSFIKPEDYYKFRAHYRKVEHFQFKTWKVKTLFWKSFLSELATKYFTGHLWSLMGSSRF
jgi:hypothetical protein